MTPTRMRICLGALFLLAFSERWLGTTWPLLGAILTIFWAGHPRRPRER